MDLTTPAIVCAVSSHGEHGAVVRFLTPTGLLAGYVRGGRSRRLRPVLQAGNGVRARLVARVDSQLAAATVELDRARTVIALTALGGSGLEWLTALTAKALTEGEAHPRLYDALDGLLEAMVLGAAPARWLAGLVKYELLLLAELGFGLDLTRCAATGAVEELVYVSPKSAQAVSRGAGAPYRAKLLVLPAFLTTSLTSPPLQVGMGPGGRKLPELHQPDGEPPSPQPPPQIETENGSTPTLRDLLAGLRLTGHFLARDVLIGRTATLLAARMRLVELAAALAPADPAGLPHAR